MLKQKRTAINHHCLNHVSSDPCSEGKTNHPYSVSTYHDHPDFFFREHNLNLPQQEAQSAVDLLPNLIFPTYYKLI